MVRAEDFDSSIVGSNPATPARERAHRRMRLFLSLAGVALDPPKRRRALGSVSPPEDLRACSQGAGRGNFRLRRIYSGRFYLKWKERIGGCAFFFPRPGSIFARKNSFLNFFHVKKINFSVLNFSLFCAKQTKGFFAFSFYGRECKKTHFNPLVILCIFNKTRQNINNPHPLGEGKDH